MRRLTALIKAIVPFPAETRDEFFKIIKVLNLMPGEWIPDDLPPGTVIFVEDGFLLLTRCKDKQWKCNNFYPEGTATVTYSRGATEMRDGSFRVRAVEPTRIYYLTQDDACRVQQFFPSYNMVSHILTRRSFLKSEQRKSLFEVPPADRILYVDTYFRSLLRAPLEDLVQFLGVETKSQKIILHALKKIRFSAREQLS